MEQGVWDGRGLLLWGRALGGCLDRFVPRISQNARKDLCLDNRAGGRLGGLRGGPPGLGTLPCRRRLALLSQPGGL